MKKGVRRQTGQRAWDRQPPYFIACRKFKARLSHQMQNEHWNHPVVIRSFDSDPIVVCWDERDF